MAEPDGGRRKPLAALIEQKITLTQWLELRCGSGRGHGRGCERKGRTWRVKTDDLSGSETQVSLAESFKRQTKTLVHRASAIYPLRLRGGTDFSLLFLDYWKLKNKIEGVSCNIRAYAADGTLAARSTRKVVSPHNEISMRDLLGEDDFDGMVEVEIIASDNLGYAFPAIIGLYEANGAYSLVHSAGRIKNPDEAAIPAPTNESNWSCKASDDISPFFHLFNGPRKRDDNEIAVAIYDDSNSVIAEETICAQIANPFSSQLVDLATIFSRSDLSRTSHVNVRFIAAETFPRLVVGNIHHSLNHLEVTHSFSRTMIDDYVPAPADETKVLSFLAGVTAPELELQLVSFPTNAPSTVMAEVRRQEFGQTALEPTGEISHLATGGPDGESFKLRLGNSDQLVCLDFKTGRVPSRLNASYQYRVRGAEAPFSTDFALGAKSHVYPPKHTHWGHGILGAGYETAILFWNIAHDRSMPVPDDAELQLFWGDDESVTAPVTLQADSGGVIYLSRLCGELASSPDARTLSWMLRTKTASIDTFYVAFTNDGRICGEHGF